MSTPISTLPLKTQPSNTGEANDINDPVVQDVLNEFQDELMMSKKSAMPQHPQMPPMPPQQSYPPQQHSPQYPQQMYPHPPIYPPTPNGKYDSISAYVDTEVAKKSLILVILAVIIYHSGIINTVYEKMPDNLQDHLTNFDIYIKSISLFSIIYVLSFFEYI
jgi:hypothetical protein